MSTTDVVLDGNVERFISEPRPFLIGGEWVRSRSDEYFQTIDPATGDHLVSDAIARSDVEDLILKANDTVYGLAAGLWTSTIKEAHTIAARLKAGTVWINCWNALDPGSAWGGYRQSGWGQETGRLGAELYTEIKNVWVNLNRRRQHRR